MMLLFLRVLAACLASRGAGARCVVYLHQNKAGGTSIKNILRDRLRPRATWTRCSFEDYDENRCAPPRGYRDGDSERDLVVAGDAVMGLRGEGGWLAGGAAPRRGCAFFTLFRDPFARLVSSWHFCRASRSDALCGSSALDARNATLPKWAEHWSAFGVTQLALTPGGRRRRRLRDTAYDDDDEGGALTRPSTWVRLREGTSAADRLSAARRFAASLDDIFDVVGILEDPASTAAAFDARVPLGGGGTWAAALSEVRNRGTTDAAAVAASRSDPAMRRLLEGDVLLYGAARRSLARALKKGARF